MLIIFNSIPLNGRYAKPRGNPTKPSKGTPQDGQPEAIIPVPAPSVPVTPLFLDKLDLIFILNNKSATYRPNNIDIIIPKIKDAIVNR